MKKQSGLLIILITYVAFISLGLPDGLLGIAWPFMSEKFRIPLDSLGILLIGFVAGYLSSSTTTGKILSVIPLGLLLTLSCAVTGLSLLVYAYTDYWLLVVIASFFLGSGGGAIDTSINTFAASRFSPSVVNWLHAFYGIGATSGPFIMTWMLSNDKGWHSGYLAVGVIQITLSLIFLMTLKYWKVAASQEEQPSSGAYTEALRIPSVWLHIFIFFIYVGIEIGVGQWIFTVLTRSRGISEEDAGMWTGAYWGSFTAGRIIIGFVLTRFSVQKVLTFAMTGIIAGTVLVAADQSDLLTFAGILTIGLSNAPVFPSLISSTPGRTGAKQLANVMGFQISAAMIGGALLPGFAGLMTGRFGLEIIPVLFTVEAVLLLILYVVSARLHKGAA